MRPLANDERVDLSLARFGECVRRRSRAGDDGPPSRPVLIRETCAHGDRFELRRERVNPLDQVASAHVARSRNPNLDAAAPSPECAVGVELQRFGK